MSYGTRACLPASSRRSTDGTCRHGRRAWLPGLGAHRSDRGAGPPPTYGAARSRAQHADGGAGAGEVRAPSRPRSEIQYLAYYHNAEDQIRGEACSLQFFSNGQYRNPMVVRVQGWSYQKGFGGHFHNDNSIAAMRDVPGLVIATPARGDDAVKMLRTLLALAKVDGRVCLMIEPI